MLQSILFFILGFLCSGFLALMVAPAIWRRAVALTRKRIEASVPLSLADIQADKDRMRAELAMEIRRLEMTVKSLREKSAAQAVEMERGRAELKRLAGSGGERGRGLSNSEPEAGEFDAGRELAMARQQATELAGRLADTRKALEAKSAELQRVGKLYDEASFAAASRQVELVARQSEVETLSGEKAELAAGRQEAERRHQELLAENRKERAALEEEKRRADLLAQQNAGLAASLRQLERTLARRGEQPARLREKVNGAASEEEPESEAPPVGQGAAPAARLACEAPELGAEAPDEGARTASPELSAAHGGRDERAAGARSGPDGGDNGPYAMLREQMNDLAAEVIMLAARLDGPDSPIATALSASTATGEPGGDGADRAASLADRVRALRRAASSGTSGPTATEPGAAAIAAEISSRPADVARSRRRRRR